jgi:enoyl-CoA hydratase
MAHSWVMRTEGEVAVLTMDDGKVNAFTVEQFKGLEAVLDAAQASDARACILTGKKGYLSAGLNLKLLAAMSLPEKRELVAAMGSAMMKLFLFAKPAVAAVSGHALGAGAMLGLACDVRVFADGPFKFGLNEVPAGLFVPSYAIELMRAAVSAERMTELVVHGRAVSPSEALTFGLAESVVAEDSLLQAAMLRAKTLAPLSGAGYALTKRLTRGPAAEAAQAKVPGELDELSRMLDSRKP